MKKVVLAIGLIFIIFLFVDYALSRVGTYIFKWHVGTEIDEAMVSTIVFVVPESAVGTLLGILASIGALISVAVLKRPQMP